MQSRPGAVLASCGHKPGQRAPQPAPPPATCRQGRAMQHERQAGRAEHAIPTAPAPAASARTSSGPGQNQRDRAAGSTLPPLGAGPPTCPSMPEFRTAALPHYEPPLFPPICGAFSPDMWGLCHRECGNSTSNSAHQASLRRRDTSMSSSVIFLRKVLRLIPKKLGAARLIPAGGIERNLYQRHLYFVQNPRI